MPTPFRKAAGAANPPLRPASAAPMETKNLPTPAVLKSRIAGEDVAPAGGARFPDVNPATGEVVCEVAAADAALLDRAVEAAKAAQQRWVALPAAERGRVLNRIAAILRERKEELARLEV